MKVSEIINVLRRAGNCYVYTRFNDDCGEYVRAIKADVITLLEGWDGDSVIDASAGCNGNDVWIN